jgi:hypothetical protein
MALVMDSSLLPTENDKYILGRSSYDEDLARRWKQVNAKEVKASLISISTSDARGQNYDGGMAKSQFGGSNEFGNSTISTTDYQANTLNTFWGKTRYGNSSHKGSSGDTIFWHAPEFRNGITVTSWSKSGGYDDAAQDYAGTSTEKFKVTSGGVITANGSATFNNNVTFNGTVKFTSTVKDSGGSTIHTSDKNVKNTIQYLSEDEKYEKLFDKLQPVSYKLNNGTSGRTHIGLIAQDLKQAILEAGLTTNDVAAYCEWEPEEADPATCGIRYEEFISLSIHEIQKLKAKVAQQDQLIADLTQRLEKLESKN